MLSIRSRPAGPSAALLGETDMANRTPVPRRESAFIRFWQKRVGEVRRGRRCRSLQRILAASALAAACGTAPASEQNAARVGVTADHTEGTSLLGVHAESAFSVDSIGGDVFFRGGILAIGSDRVDDGVLVDVAGGLSWPWPVSPHFGAGIVGGPRVFFDDEVDVDTELDDDRGGVYGEAGLRLQPSGPVSVNLTSKHYFIAARDGGNAGISMIGVTLQYDIP